MIFIDYIRRQKVSGIFKKYAVEANALIGKKGVNCDNFSQLSSRDVEILLSLSKNEWEEWKELKTEYAKLDHTYHNVILEYIKKNFFKNTANELTLHELRILISESNQIWYRLNAQRNQYLEISKKYREGVEQYQKIHTSCSVQDIIKNIDEVMELQNCYDESKLYTFWIEQQKVFSDEIFRDSFKSIQSLDRSVITLPYSYPNEFGLTQNIEIKISGVYYIKFTLENYKNFNDDIKKRNEKYSKFKNDKLKFKTEFYDKVVEAFKKMNETYSSNLLVLFVMNNALNWERNIYETHYQYLLNKFDENEIQHQELSNYLTTKGRKNNYDAITIIAMASNESDLFESFNAIIRSNKKKIPRLGYISFLQEMNQLEISLAIEEGEKNIEDQKKIGIRFIKEQFLRIGINPYFTYLAITNTLIGGASGASSVKQIWLSQPEQYQLNTTSENEITYSCNFGKDFDKIDFSGSFRNLDDVSYFTYELFTKMGVMDDFLAKGTNAVDFMVDHNFLTNR